MKSGGRKRLHAKAAADAGEFNVSKWATKSSSLKGVLSWLRRIQRLFHCLPLKPEARAIELQDRAFDLEGIVATGLAEATR